MIVKETQGFFSVALVALHPSLFKKPHLDRRNDHDAYKQHKRHGAGNSPVTKGERLLIHFQTCYVGGIARTSGARHDHG